LGALLLGYFEGAEFVFAGKVGTGFDTKLLLALREQLDSIEVPTSPFTKAVGLPRLRAHWVRPEIVVEVAYSDIQRSPRYAAGMALRFARILHVRIDKSAEEADTIDTLAAEFDQQPGRSSRTNKQ